MGVRFLYPLQIGSRFPSLRFRASSYILMGMLVLTSSPCGRGIPIFFKSAAKIHYYFEISKTIDVFFLYGVYFATGIEGVLGVCRKMNDPNKSKSKFKNPPIVSQRQGDTNNHRIINRPLFLFFLIFFWLNKANGTSFVQGLIL